MIISSKLFNPLDHFLATAVACSPVGCRGLFNPSKRSRSTKPPPPISQHFLHSSHRFARGLLLSEDSSTQRCFWLWVEMAGVVSVVWLAIRVACKKISLQWVTDSRKASKLIGEGGGEVQESKKRKSQENIIVRSLLFSLATYGGGRRSHWLHVALGCVDQDGETSRQKTPMIQQDVEATSSDRCPDWIQPCIGD